MSTQDRREGYSEGYDHGLVNGRRKSYAEIDRLRAENERLRAAHKENARLLGLVIHDLQGRVDGGKLAALTQCRDCAEEAYQQNHDAEIEELRAALKAGTDAAQTLLSLPADECNVPFDPVNAAEIKGRRKAARHILDILNQQKKD